MSEKIFITLTEDEIREAGRELAAKVYELEDLKSSAKEVAKDYRDLAKDLSHEIMILTDAIRSGQQERPAQMEFDNVRSLKDAG